VEAIDLALTAARRRRLELVRSRYQLRAADLRLRAGEKQAELDTLNSQTEKLLRKLSELEEVDYGHWAPSAAATGSARISGRRTNGWGRPMWHPIR
jgi:hypothetical protein